MIILYNANETNFNNNGVAVLDNVLYSRPKIIEELNGNLTLECEIAITGNTKHELIEDEMIIKADDNYFRIRETRKNNNRIYLFAKQLFWDLEKNLLDDVRPENLSGASAINWISTHTSYQHPFIFTCDVPIEATAYYIRKDPVAAIMSEDNAFLKVWGGEMELDKFNVTIHQRRGMDRGVAISYGKNLMGIEEDLNTSSVVTRIMPTGRDENGNIIELPEKYKDSQYINHYSHPKISVRDYPNIKVDSNSGITLDTVYNQLREEVQKLYDSGIDLPYYNYTIKFKELSQTEEYKRYAVLERVYLGDTVTIKHQKLGINLMSRLIKTTKEYNAARQEWQYKELELGQFKQNLISQYKAEKQAIQNAIDIQTSGLQKGIDNATGLLNNALGGYVLKRNGEILIMDTQDPMTATKVWRWNVNGLGYSKTGINGPYETAMTMDGNIIGKFISAYSITTNKLSSDVGQNLDISSNRSITTLSQDFNIQIGKVDEIDGSIKTINTYFDFRDTGLTIGKTDSPLNISISNSEIDFIDNGNVVAYINGQKMHIGSLDILYSLIVGVHKLEKYNSDITLIRWVGGS